MVDKQGTSLELGQYRGRRYFLRGEADPNEQQPEEFAVTVYYRDPDAEANVEIARVDTSHGYTHIDRLYRRDQEKEQVGWSYWEAIEELIENWRTYAERYEQTHEID